MSGEFSSPSLAPVFVGTMELDRMVIGGDWEGIVLGAAQFEGGTRRRWWRKRRWR